MKVFCSDCEYGKHIFCEHPDNVELDLDALRKVNINNDCPNFKRRTDVEDKAKELEAIVFEAEIRNFPYEYYGKDLIKQLMDGDRGEQLWMLGRSNPKTLLDKYTKVRIKVIAVRDS